MERHRDIIELSKILFMQMRMATGRKQLALKRGEKFFCSAVMHNTCLNESCLGFEFFIYSFIQINVRADVLIAYNLLRNNYSEAFTCHSFLERANRTGQLVTVPKHNCCTLQIFQ